jgi:hypothetical protein
MISDLFIRLVREEVSGSDHANEVAQLSRDLHSQCQVHEAEIKTLKEQLLICTTSLQQLLSSPEPDITEVVPNYSAPDGHDDGVFEQPRDHEVGQASL